MSDKANKTAETAEDIGQAFIGCGCGLTILVFLILFLLFIFAW